MTIRKGILLFWFLFGLCSLLRPATGAEGPNPGVQISGKARTPLLAQGLAVTLELPGRGEDWKGASADLAKRKDAILTKLNELGLKPAEPSLGRLSISGQAGQQARNQQMIYRMMHSGRLRQMPSQTKEAAKAAAKPQMVMNGVLTFHLALSGGNALALFVETQELQEKLRATLLPLLNPPPAAADQAKKPAPGAEAPAGAPAPGAPDAVVEEEPEEESEESIEFQGHGQEQRGPLNFHFLASPTEAQRQTVLASAVEDARRQASLLAKALGKAEAVLKGINGLDAGNSQIIHRYSEDEDQMAGSVGDRLYSRLLELDLSCQVSATFELR